MRNFLLLISIISSLRSCRWMNPSKTSAIEILGPIPSSENAALVWKKYHDNIPLDKYLKEGIQDQCRPRVFPSKTEKTKGVMLLLHGYSACPQQYFEWAERLSAESWEVVIPLHPGHGYTQLAGEDNTKYLPNTQNYKEVYGGFVDQMNELMEAYPKDIPKNVAGLSLGGAMATYALSEAPDLYDEAVIMTPAFEYSNWKARYVSRILFSLRNWSWVTSSDKYKELMESYQGWGEPCEKERELGRSGICDFLAKHAIAMNEFGKEAARKVNKAIQTKTQFVIVEDDAAVKNSEILKVFKRFNSRKNGREKTSICAMPKTANHSLLSRFDNPDLEKWWLDRLLAQLDSFVNEGFFIPTSQKILYDGVSSCVTANDTLRK